MKNIRPLRLEKYNDPSKFEKITDVIYKSLEEGNYRLALSCELERAEDTQYPLADILEELGDDNVVVSEFYEEEYACDKNGYMMSFELETISDGEDDYKSISAIAALIGKCVYNLTRKKEATLVVESMSEAVARMIRDYGKDVVSGGATDEAVAGAEKALGVKFPPEYLGFVKAYGSCRIGDIEIKGVESADEASVVKATEKYRQFGLEPNVIVVVDTGEFINCVDTTEGAVYTFCVIGSGLSEKKRDYDNFWELAFEEFHARLDDIYGKYTDYVDDEDDEDNPTGGRGTCFPCSKEQLQLAEENKTVIHFAGYDWRVLEVRDDKALLLTDKIIAPKVQFNDDDEEQVTISAPSYDESLTAGVAIKAMLSDHSPMDIQAKLADRLPSANEVDDSIYDTDWARCTLRRELNGGFFGHWAGTGSISLRPTLSPRTIRGLIPTAANLPKATSENPLPVTSGENFAGQGNPTKQGFVPCEEG